MNTSTESDLLAARAEIIRLRHENDQLRWQIHHDPQTGVLSREGLIDTWQKLLDAGDTPAALVVLDLDNFRAVNTQYGHDVGDDLLRAVASQLNRHWPGRVSRTSRAGDEFAIAIPAAELADNTIDLTGDLIVQTLAGLSVAGAYIPGASVGIAEVGSPGPCVWCDGTGEGEGWHCSYCSGTGHDLDTEHLSTDLAVLLKQADIAMYASKAAGRGRWSLYDPIATPQQPARQAVRRVHRDRVDLTRAVA